MLLFSLINFYDYCWLQLYRVIAVPAEKMSGSNTLLPKNFVEVFSNHHILALHGNETKFCTQIYGKDKKSFSL